MDKFKHAIFGLRKLSFAVLLLGVTTICLALGLLSSDDFALIWAASAPAFMASTLAEHILDKRQEKR